MDVATRLNGFLIKFQTDGPMVLFLSEELGEIFVVAYGFVYSKRGGKSC